MSTEFVNPWEDGYDVAASGEVLPGGIGRPNFRKQEDPEEKLKAKATKKIIRKADLAEIGDAPYQIKTAIEKLREREFDPMDLLIDVAKGESLLEDHPYLYVLFESLAALDECLMYQGGEGALMIIEKIRVEARSHLLDSHTDKETRIKVAEKLMEYTRAKIKSSDGVVDNEYAGPPQPLTEDEVQLFKEWFEDEF